MKKLLLILAFVLSANAYAGLVFLQSGSCKYEYIQEMGKMQWIGKYSQGAGSRTFTLYFDNFCPTSVEM